MTKEKDTYSKTFSFFLQKIYIGFFLTSKYENNMNLSIKENIEKQVNELGPSFDFEKVPADEKKQQWYLSLEPIIVGCLKSRNPQNLFFVKTLFDKKHSDWRLLKKNN